MRDRARERERRECVREKEENGRSSRLKCEGKRVRGVFHHKVLSTRGGGGNMERVWETGRKRVRLIAVNFEGKRQNCGAGKAGFLRQPAARTDRYCVLCTMYCVLYLGCGIHILCMTRGNFTVTEMRTVVQRCRLSFVSAVRCLAVY